MALAHTPKRDLSKPITRNDLQGSKMLINFCDSAFAIGECHSDKSLRYIKQIKARNTEIVFDTENVCVFEIQKLFNFLQFNFLCTKREQELLKRPSDEDNDELVQKIVELKTEGQSLRDMGKELGISHSKVGRIIKKQEV